MIAYYHAVRETARRIADAADAAREKLFARAREKIE
jgi:hypothetical protein